MSNGNPRIIACYKWVRDEADIKAAPNSREISLERVGFKISDYDRNALEEGVRLQELHGGSVTAITVGLPSAKNSLKDALSRGPEQAVFVNDPAFADLEPAQTASLLASVISTKLEYDLIICGEGSSDLYAQQVGPRLAEILGIPCITYVQKLTLEGQQIIAERRLDEAVEVVAVPLPALITVLPGINQPRIPSLKQVLAAAKKPVVNLTKADLDPGCDWEPRLETLSIAATSLERRGVKFTAETEDIRKFVSALVQAGAFK